MRSQTTWSHINFELQFISMDLLEKIENFRVDLGKTDFLYVFLDHEGACAGYSPQEPTASGKATVDRLLSPSHVLLNKKQQCQSRHWTPNQQFNFSVTL